MSTTPDPKTKPVTAPSTSTSTGTTAPAKTKAAETLKVAYTKRADGQGFIDVVVFGTDADRSAFLRANADVWWRLADVAKGEILTSHEEAKPNG